MLVDSHCHLNMLNDQRTVDDYVEAARDAGVTHMLCVSTQLETFPEILRYADKYHDVSCSLGVHPTEETIDDLVIDDLVKLADQEQVVAIGETGLDYYRLDSDVELQCQRQRQNFCHHIEVAKAVNKPLIVHTRQARDDTIDILTQQQASLVGGVMHCFTESWEMAVVAMDLGFYISFSGIVTFKNALELKGVAKKVPADRFLIETDAPFLAPTPYRGKPNEPAYVAHVAEYLAQLRQTDFATIARQSSDNFYRLFKVKRCDVQNRGFF